MAVPIEDKSSHLGINHRIVITDLVTKTHAAISSRQMIDLSFIFNQDGTVKEKFAFDGAEDRLRLGG